MKRPGQEPAMNDPHNLQRFVDAQADVYERALAELSAGAKRSHWMWFIFPEIAGLGFSAMAQRYAVGSKLEAEAYLAHPMLGPRLTGCTRAVLAVEARSAHEIFGSPDDLKFRSSMTLFDAVAPDGIFVEALRKYFDGRPDEVTLNALT
jgi:uncharacterized protein (DUF1810 family)